MVTCGASLVVVVQLKKAFVTSQIIQERPNALIDEGQTAVASMVQALIGGGRTQLQSQMQLTLYSQQLPESLENQMCESRRVGG